MAVSFFGLIVLLILVTCLIGACGFAVRAFTSRDTVSTHVPMHRSSPASVIVAFVFAGLILFAVLGMFFMTARVSVQQRPATATIDHQALEGESVAPVVTHHVSESRSDFKAGVTVTVKKNGEESEAATDSEPDTSNSVPALPEWTQSEERTFDAGRVPVVRLVVRSGLYATQDEATAEAHVKVHDELRGRLATDYPKLAAWKIPQRTLSNHSIKQTFTEVRQTQFGQYREPMYQVWVQYEDSPHVRESIIHEWERSAVDGRTVLFAAGAGIVALLLGTVSAGVRTVTAPRGRRGKPALATLALGVGTGLATMSVFIS